MAKKTKINIWGLNRSETYVQTLLFKKNALQKVIKDEIQQLCLLVVFNEETMTFLFFLEKT